jgi:hypothetical protein
MREIVERRMLEIYVSKSKIGNEYGVSADELPTLQHALISEMLSEFAPWSTDYSELNEGGALEASGIVLCDAPEHKALWSGCSAPINLDARVEHVIDRAVEASKVEARMLRLVDVVNRAKDAELLIIANAAFAVLVEELTDTRASTLSTDARAFLETRDETGVYADEAYYDLLVIEVAGKSANIPVGLLRQETLVTLMKDIEIVEREEHRRETVLATDEEREQLAAELFSVEAPIDVAIASNVHLANSEAHDWAMEFVQ